MVQASAPRTNRTARVPYASPAAALKFPGRCKLPDGSYKDRRDIDNGCQCESYVDILTAGRWRALGYHIRAGEHAAFHGGKEKHIPLFCRCQITQGEDADKLAANLARIAELETLLGIEEPIPGFESLADDTDTSDGIPGFETMPTMVEAPIVESGTEPAGEAVSAPIESPIARETAAPTVMAEAPEQTIAGVPVVRLQLVRDSSVTAVPREITGPASTVDIFRAYLGDPDREHVVMLAVDTKNHPVGIHTVSIGSLNSSIVNLREIFKAACLMNAAAIILCHNHPSGDPTPSQEDVSITRKIREAGTLLDIELLDHVVLGAGDAWVSLRERGLGF